MKIRQLLLMLIALAALAGCAVVPADPYGRYYDQGPYYSGRYYPYPGPPTIYYDAPRSYVVPAPAPVVVPYFGFGFRYGTGVHHGYPGYGGYRGPRGFRHR